MRIRICLEPAEGTRADSPRLIRRVADHAMAEFGAGFAGYISVDAMSTVYGRREPLWQYIAFGATQDQVDAVLTTDAELMVPGYIAHVSIEQADRA